MNMNLKNLQAFRLDSEERVVLKFRKHWFILLRDSIGTALAALVPALALVLAAWANTSILSAMPASVISFIQFWWLLIVWLALSVIWTNYYLDLWMITDKRIVSVDQTGLFSRKVTVLPFGSVQDVTVEQHGIIQTFLNFGTVKVQTAGPTAENMTIVGVAKPAAVRDKIIEETERWRARKL